MRTNSRGNDLARAITSCHAWGSLFHTGGELPENIYVTDEPLAPRALLLELAVEHPEKLPGRLAQQAGE
eukprot:5982664-Pyramimonas_sp.AAC.1